MELRRSDGRVSATDLACCLVAGKASTLLFQYPDPLPNSQQETKQTFLGSLQVGASLFVPFAQETQGSNVMLLGILQLDAQDGTVRGDPLVELGSSSLTTLAGPFAYSDDAFFVVTRKENQRGGPPTHTVHIIDANTFAVMKTADIQGIFKIDTIQKIPDTPQILFARLYQTGDKITLGLLNVNDSTIAWQKEASQVNPSKQPVIDGQAIFVEALADDDSGSSVVIKINIADGTVATKQPNIGVTTGHGYTMAYDETNKFLYFATYDETDEGS